MSTTGSSPRRSRSQSTSMSTSMSSQTSPIHRSSKRAFSAAASPRNTGPREKRARRDESPSPRSSPPTTPSKSFSTPFVAPVPSPLTTLFTNLASSAPTTPLLPSSSSSFFPAVSSSTSHNNTHMQPSLPTSLQYSRAMLDDLHREAFTSLRNSLAQSGEGFLRRMRDWEERRNKERNKVFMAGVQERGRDRRRARRLKILHADNLTVGGMSETHPPDDISSFPHAGILHPARHPGNMSGYRSFLCAQVDSDIEDTLIDNVEHSLLLPPSESKPRAGSLGKPPVDIPDSQELFAVELAHTNADCYPSAHYSSTFDFPFTCTNTRSSSPFSFGNTSDDESSSGSRYDQAHSRFSSPCHMSSSVGRSSHTISTRKMHGEGVHHSSPCTSPCPSSPGFSCSRSTTRRHISVQSLNDASTHMHTRAVSDTSSQVAQTASDKALAALVLALANGSGSLADYGYVREAQGELEELEAGGLWE